MTQDADPLRVHVSPLAAKLEVAPSPLLELLTSSGSEDKRAKRSTPRRRSKPKTPRSESELQHKRKRHADAERERTHRKQSELVRMRTLVTQLEQQLKSLANEANASPEHVDALADAPWLTTKNAEEGDDKTDDPTTDGDSDLRRLYVRALSQVGWLRREKSWLQAKLNDFGLLEATIESLLKDINEASTEFTEEASVASVLAEDADDDEDMLFFPMLLASECYDIMRECIAESKQFIVHPNADSPVMALGWSAQCQQRDTEMRFVLSKTFPDADLVTIMNSIWLTFQNSDISQKIFASMVQIKTLQYVNDDVLVLKWLIDCRRRIPHMLSSRKLLFRWKTDDGYFIGCRNIDSLLDPLSINELIAPSVSPTPSESSPDHFYWAQISRDASGNGCHVTVAGRLGNGTTDFARFLLTGIPICIMRWESIVVGPLFNFLTTPADP
ncbi:hypothetical protein Poli38472_014189 [Pythium oligandrum]|uniref:Uncharacterized protein n=1 Tax=Pythium oligandrum TaxID=41045 RepID=A0A8K1CIK3_PYTOL|nr:hypothetical protein Poli38472_014189 [Pythium oligandrum]|eukprot:TMW64072.1 hypothetical protein Poli38472_014189 [Pythium oligandrum]